MLPRIVEASLRHRAFVLLAAFALIAGGLWSATHLPIDAVPDITGVQVQINTEVPALAAEESEKQVTQLIEREMAGIPDVTDMRSITKFGLSQVTLSFADHADIYRARQLVAERLQSLAGQLPKGAAPKLAPISTGLGEIFYYSVAYRADATNKPATEFEQLLELSQIQEYTIKPLLRTVKGIAEINQNGGYEPQIVIEPRPEALAAAGMTFSEFAEAIAQNAENAGGGIIDRGGQQLTIRAVSRANTPEQIAELPLKFGAGLRPILVKDLAIVKKGAHFRTGAATVNGREAVIASTLMLTGENGREVAGRVKARIAEIQTKLPAGVEIIPQYDRSELIGRTLSTVETNLFEGAILVVVVLLIFLGNWRAALIVASAIPLAFLFALIGMERFGISGNLMSLGAIDFGLIIDGSVVVVENIVRRLADRQHHLKRIPTVQERNAVILDSMREVGSPMFFGVIIITVVYIPILALTGIEGKMFHPMALTVMLALAGALLLSITLMPVLCSLFLGGKIQERENPAIRIAKKVYAPALRAALRHRWLVVVSAAILFSGSLFLLQRLGAEFIPKLDEGSITAMLYKPVGMSVDESLRTDIEASKKLIAEFPEISRVFTRIGTSQIASDPMPPNESDIYIFYKPLNEWPKTEGRPRTKGELSEKVEAALKEINADYEMLFAQPIEMRFNEMLEGTKAELSVKIFGDDYDVLETLAAQIKKILEKTEGIGEVEFETEGRISQLQIKTRREVLQRYGAQAAELNKTISSALAGEVVGLATDGERRQEVVVRMPDNLRADDEQIKKLPVRIGANGLVELGKLVDFETVKVVEPINRDDGHRRAALMVNLDTRDIEGFVRRAQASIREQVQLPENYTVEFGGQFENLQKARGRLAVIVPAALALIFFLIFMAFDSLRQAVMIYAGIPLAVTGGVAALWLRDMPFSLPAAVGFIALSGVAVLNGLMIVSSFNQLRANGKSVEDSVVEGSMARLRPVLMTALVASFGFIPMALATGAGAEVQRPLATVVIGGIASSTLLTLALLPSLYLWIEGRSEKRKLRQPLTADPSAPESPQSLSEL
jgi:cobalt-zinc-cadmium resistance protein CzcA